jgi:hypothetical protein
VHLPQSARDFIGEGANATLVTLRPDGTPHVGVVWVGLELSDGRDQIVMAHLGE